MNILAVHIRFFRFIEPWHGGPKFDTLFTVLDPCSIFEQNRAWTAILLKMYYFGLGLLVVPFYPDAVYRFRSDWIYLLNYFSFIWLHNELLSNCKGCFKRQLFKRTWNLQFHRHRMIAILELPISRKELVGGQFVEPSWHPRIGKRASYGEFLLTMLRRP